MTRCFFRGVTSQKDLKADLRVMSGIPELNEVLPMKHTVIGKPNINSVSPSDETRMETWQ